MGYDDYALREKALEHAIRCADYPGESTQETLERAHEFYMFLRGEQVRENSAKLA